MEFAYKAKKGLNEVLEGTIEAQSKEQALDTLIERGLFVLSIAPAAPQKVPPRLRRRRIKTKDILFFVQRLGILCRAKVELLTSLKLLHGYAESKNFKDIILEIYNLTKTGKTFSQALQEFPKVFSPIFVSIIKAGEESGHIDQALAQINDFMSREDNLKSKIAVALAYPSFLLFVGIASIIVLMNFIVPRLATMFEGAGELPLLTQVVLGISKTSQPWIIAGIVLAVVVFFVLRKTGMLQAMGTVKRKIPVVKQIIVNQELVSFSRSLSLLLRSGVSTLNALETASRAVDNKKTREELKQVCSQVASGKPLSRSMQELSSLPDFFIKMVALGEESGRLGEVLEEVAAVYTQEVEKSIGFIASLLEPLLILFLGGILGAIVISILLPIFQIVQAVN